MGDGKRVLVASYGGGHVQSVIPIVKLLQDRPDRTLDVIGFTTARAAFAQSGIRAQGYRCLVEGEDAPWLELAQSLRPEESHPSVDEADTEAYYGLGLRDLVLQYGDAAGMQHYRERGRRAFCPVEVFKRYLGKNVPDVVITTTSPRSELALQFAANDLGIPALAVSDLFLQAESQYVCLSRYAKYITVIAGYVADYLVQIGCEERRLRITGNPAFDSLKNPMFAQEAQRLRSDLCLGEGVRTVLWVCPSAAFSITGKAFVGSDQMLTFLEEYCRQEGNTKFLVRQHPNNPVLGDRALINGVMLSPEIPIETCIQLADIVLLETSTVGLQAALLGKPVVTVNAGDYPPYARLGLASDVEGLDAAAKALTERRPPNLDLLGYRNLGSSAAAIVGLIDSILERG